MLKQAIINVGKACALVLRSAVLILCSCMWYVAFQVAKFCFVLLLAVGIAYSLFYFAERARGHPIAYHRFELHTVARREIGIRNVEEIGDMETKYRGEDAQGRHLTMLKRKAPETDQKLDSAPSGKAKPRLVKGETYEMQSTDTINPSPAPSEGLRSSPVHGQQKPSDGLKPSAGSSKKAESKVSEKFRKPDEAIATERAITSPTSRKRIETKGEVAHKTERRAVLKGELEETKPTTIEKGCWAKMVGFCCGSEGKNEQNKEPNSSKTVKQEKEPYRKKEEQQLLMTSAGSEPLPISRKEQGELFSSAKLRNPDGAIADENIKKQSEQVPSEPFKPTHETKEINKPKMPEMQPPVRRKHDQATKETRRTEEVRDRIRKRDSLKREQYEPQSVEPHISRPLRRNIDAYKMSEEVDRPAYIPKDFRKSADSRLERYLSEVYLKGTPKVRRVASDTWNPSAPSIGVPASRTPKKPRDKSPLDDKDVSMFTFACPSKSTPLSKDTSPLQNQSTPYVVDPYGVDRLISSTKKKNIIIPTSKHPRGDRPPLERSGRVEELEANEIDESMSASAPANTSTPKSPREGTSPLRSQSTPYVIYDGTAVSRKVAIHQKSREDRDPTRGRKLRDEFESHKMEESNSSPAQSFLKGTPKVHRVASDTWDPVSPSLSSPLPAETHEDKATSASTPKESVTGRNLGEKNRATARKSEGTKSENHSPSPETSKKQRSPPRRKTG